MWAFVMKCRRALASAGQQKTPEHKPRGLVFGQVVGGTGIEPVTPAV